MEEEMTEELEAMRVAFTRSISTSGKSTYKDAYLKDSRKRMRRPMKNWSVTVASPALGDLRCIGFLMAISSRSTFSEMAAREMRRLGSGLWVSLTQTRCGGKLLERCSLTTTVPFSTRYAGHGHEVRVREAHGSESNAAEGSDEAHVTDTSRSIHIQ
jgi:hypothetical protein